MQLHMHIHLHKIVHAQTSADMSAQGRADGQTCHNAGRRVHDGFMPVTVYVLLTMVNTTVMTRTNNILETRFGITAFFGCCILPDYDVAQSFHSGRFRNVERLLDFFGFSKYDVRIYSDLLLFPICLPGVGFYPWCETALPTLGHAGHVMALPTPPDDMEKKDLQPSCPPPFKRCNATNLQTLKPRSRMKSKAS